METWQQNNIATRWTVLIDLIKSNGYKRIAEIGVHRGKTARQILTQCDLEWYLLVDPVGYRKLFDYVLTIPYIRYYLVTSELAVKLCADGEFDLVFIDALHTYGDVKNDIAWWTPKVRSGGILCGDDYEQEHCPGVKRAVDEAFGDRVELVSVGHKKCKVWMVEI